MTPPDRAEAVHRLGSTLRVDDRTVLVLGQELDVASNQPDVANVVLHRVDDTLFMVDTGVTAEFREALKSAVDLVGPWSRLVVLITHGHPDHVGNNDLVDELAEERGIQAELVVPAADVAQMRDPQSYWKTSFDRLAGLAPLPAAPGLVALKITSLFQPYRPFSRHTRTYEQTAPEAITIGGRRFTGWSWADGAVSVLRSQGHCAGHVVVYLRDNQLLHLGDEVNGPCPVMHDADQQRLTDIQTAALDLIDGGVVTHLTDGHTFAVQDAATASARLRELLHQGLVLQGAAAGLVDGQPTVRGDAFTAGLTQRYSDLAVQGANPSPVFLAMMAASQLRRLGYTRSGLSDGWHAPHLTVDATPARTVTRTVTGAAATLPWILRGHRKEPGPHADSAS